MKNRKERKKSQVLEQAEPIEINVAGLIGKMQQQLVSLEGKIDRLLNQAQAPAPQSMFFKKDNFRGKSYTNVICSDCKKECQVPFKPSGGRPVYCRDCFAKRKGDKPFRPVQDNRQFNKPQADEKQYAGQKRKSAPNRIKKRGRK